MRKLLLAGVVGVPAMFLTPTLKFVPVNHNVPHDLPAADPGLTDLLRLLDAACKDEGEALQREQRMLNQCQENHRQLVDKGLAR
jgi:hypothetical protein